MGAMIVRPNPRPCQAQHACATWWSTIDALGITPDQICANDLRPHAFAIKGLRISRAGSAAYCVWSRRTLPDDEPSEAYGSSRTVAAMSEQEAGALLLELTNLGTGIEGRALRRWLELWGWTPPPGNNPSTAPPLIVI